MPFCRFCHEAAHLFYFRDVSVSSDTKKILPMTCEVTCEVTCASNMTSFALDQSDSRTADTLQNLRSEYSKWC